MRGGIKSRLREVEDTSKADDEAVDFSESGKTEDFGGVVAGSSVSKELESGGLDNLRYCGIVQGSVKHEEDNVCVCGPCLRNHA